MNPETILKDATPDGPIQISTTYRRKINGEVFMVEGRRQVPDRNQFISPYPETYHCMVQVNIGPGGIFPVELDIPGDNIHDVFDGLNAFLAQEVPKQAPIQIQASQAKARARQSAIKVPGR